MKQKDFLLDCEKPSYKQKFWNQDSILVKTLLYLRKLRKKRK